MFSGYFTCNWWRENIYILTYAGRNWSKISFWFSTDNEKFFHFRSTAHLCRFKRSDFHPSPIQFWFWFFWTTASLTRFCLSSSSILKGQIFKIHIFFSRITNTFSKLLNSCEIFSEMMGYWQDPKEIVLILEWVQLVFSVLISIYGGDISCKISWKISNYPHIEKCIKTRLEKLIEISFISKHTVNPDHKIAHLNPVKTFLTFVLDCLGGSATSYIHKCSIIDQATLWFHWRRQITQGAAPYIFFSLTYFWKFRQLLRELLVVLNWFHPYSISQVQYNCTCSWDKNRWSIPNTFFIILGIIKPKQALIWENNFLSCRWMAISNSLLLLTTWKPINSIDSQWPGLIEFHLDHRPLLLQLLRSSLFFIPWTHFGLTGNALQIFS